MADNTNDVKTKSDSSSDSSEKSSNTSHSGMEDSQSSQDSVEKDATLDSSLTDFINKRVGSKISAPDAEDDSSLVEEDDTKEKEIGDELDSKNELNKADKEKVEDKEEDSDKEEKEEKEKDKDEDKEKGDKEEEEEGDEDEEKSDDEDKDKAEGEDDEDKDKGPVPYKRFKEVNSQKTELSQKIETEYKPKLERYDRITNFCETKQISPEEFQEALNVQALISSGNVDDALKKLEPLVEALKGMNGSKLPEDLQKDVDAGDITLRHAKEIAQLRAKSKFGEISEKRKQANSERRQQEQFASQVESDARAWEIRTRQNDPDYKPKKSESSPDGLWELARDKYLADLNRVDSKGQYVNPVTTPKAMTDLLDKAYRSAKATLSGARGVKPKTRPVLRSSEQSSRASSGKKTIEEADTLEEAVAIRMAERR